MKKSTKDILVIGFALFAMFFGAGNLIFPPYLGKSAGSNYMLAIIGFIITGVGLPLLGIIACAKFGGSFQDIAQRINRPFSIVVTTALVLSIGPMLAIPRTAATTYELGVQPFFPNVGPLPTIIVYFLINLIFVLRPSSIIDDIGKILTPALLVMLSLIIIKGIAVPIGEVVVINRQNVFSSSLLEGYQTMDAMASVIFSNIVLASVTAKGYSKKEEVTKMTIMSGLVAVIGLGFIYGGLLYLGAQTVNILPAEVTKTVLVTEIAKKTLGSFGSIALALSVSLACLTTSIGLTASAAEFFSKLSKGRIGYKVTAIIITIASIFIATMGLNAIVALAVPILSILYPIVIVFIIAALAGRFVKNDKILKVTIYTTLAVSVLDTINSLGYTNLFINRIIGFIPLASIGFTWVIPSFAAFILASIFIKDEGDNKEKKILKKSA